MTIHRNKGLTYFTFSELDDLGVTHGVFMRHGGVSKAPWHSLNLATSVGDTRENVIENRHRITDALGLEADSIYDVWQVHSNVVSYSSNSRKLENPHKKADAIITDNPDVTLMMLFADCVPILFYAPDRNITAIAHAGWRGTVKRVAKQTITEMVEIHHCNPKAIIACIGPAICVNHYPFGGSVIESVRAVFGSEKEVGRYINGQFHLNLSLANEKIIRRTGVSRVFQSGICTAENASDWFSHRAEDGQTGRFAAVITCRTSP